MDQYNHFLQQTKEYGVVTEVKGYILNLDGLPHARVGEVIVFENGAQGYVFRIENNNVRVLLLTRIPIRVGVKAVRTDQDLTVAAGDSLLGSVVDPLGNPVIPSKDYKKPEVAIPLLVHTIPLSERSRIHRPFRTGVTIVDFMIPLGMGQKEVVVGDRKVGKSSFFLTTVKTQIIENPKQVVIYALIGKNASDIKQLIEKYQKANLLGQMIFVISTADDSPSLIELTPISAMLLARHFSTTGRDCVVVLDDLSTHARYHREIMLSAGEFPGRESYPGDIFFTHSRLLELAGSFKTKTGAEVSITCFPIVETIEGDIASYICTNIMSMTDGHIYYDSNAYFNGRRPAIDPTLSVTRVGKQAQGNLKRELSHEIAVFLSQYERSLNYSHFGAELSQKVKDLIRKGDLLYQFFDQHYEEVLPESALLVLLALIWLGSMDKLANVTVADCKKRLTAAYSNPQTKVLLDSFAKVPNMYELLTTVAQKEQELLTLCKA